MTAALHHPERIAVGIDGSITAHAAVRWAIGHARPGDTVILCHAWRPSPITVEAGLTEPDDDAVAHAFVRHELARVSALPRDNGVIVEGKVLHGDPRDGLGEIEADLLVVGSGGHGTLSSALLGSVSAHLAKHARVPLVIVPQHWLPGSKGT